MSDRKRISATPTLTRKHKNLSGRQKMSF